MRKLVLSKSFLSKFQLSLDDFLINQVGASSSPLVRLLLTRVCIEFTLRFSRCSHSSVQADNVIVNVPGHVCFFFFVLVDAKKSPTAYLAIENMRLIKWLLIRGRISNLWFRTLYSGCKVIVQSQIISLIRMRLHVLYSVESLSREHYCKTMLQNWEE